MGLCSLNPRMRRTAPHPTAPLEELFGVALHRTAPLHGTFDVAPHRTAPLHGTFDVALHRTARFENWFHVAPHRTALYYLRMHLTSHCIAPGLRGEGEWGRPRKALSGSPYPSLVENRSCGFLWSLGISLELGPNNRVFPKNKQFHYKQIWFSTKNSNFMVENAFLPKQRKFIVKSTVSHQKQNSNFSVQIGFSTQKQQNHYEK